MKISKKFISVLLSLLMIVSLIPMGMVSASAATTCGLCVGCGHEQSKHYGGHCIMCWSAESGSCESEDNYTACALEKGHSGDHSATASTVDFTTTHYYCELCQMGSSSFISNDGNDVAEHIWTAHDGDINYVMNFSHECGDEEHLCGDPECPNTPAGPTTPAWVATIISKVDAASKDLVSEEWGVPMSLKGYLANTDFDSLDSLVSDMDAPEYSQEGSVYTIKGETSYGEFTVTITLDADENIASAALNYSGAYTVTFTPALAGNPLTFTAEEAGATMSFAWNAGSDVQIKASSTSVTVGGSNATGEWQDYTATTTITLPNVGDSVQFKGTDVITNAGNTFTIKDKKIAASGDVTSLTNGVGGDVELKEANCYQFMFYDCTALTSAPALPSTTLSKSCYYYIFQGCSNLTTAPELPATELANGCYAGMFRACTSLPTAPSLPATKLKENCYSNMFQGCSSLTTAPSLPATEIAKQCYYYMFSDCTSLTTAPSLPATELFDYCYQHMFCGCTSLTSVPELKATTLATRCYYNMFNGCTSLRVVGTDKQSEATWIFPATEASDWNGKMIDGLTAPGTLKAVKARKMYKVTAVCGMCTECGHPWSKHDPVGDCCSLCPVGDGCFDEILGEQCVLDAGHDGAHDSWLTITNTDDINAILTKVVGEYKDADYPYIYSVKISGNATDGFSYVYNDGGTEVNAVFVRVKQKGNEVFVEINYDTGSSTHKAGFTFVFDSQGKLTACYQVSYKVGGSGVSNYYAYPYVHVHTWNNGTCTLDGTTCSHIGMTTSDATCGTCGITNPSYVPPHTHTFATTWSSDATQHWYAATCEHTTEKSSLGNHSGGTATCTAAAVCSTCGASYGSALGHSFATEWSKDATHHWHAATCGHTDQKSDYAQHSYTSEVTTPATCTSAGVTTYTCTCGDTYTDTTAPAALGHSFTNYVPNNDATCTEDGTKTAVCDRNGCSVTDTITDEGTATGHSFTTKASTSKATDATCTEAATYYVQCDNCTAVDTVKTVPVGNSLGHSFATEWSKDATHHWHAATCGHTDQKSDYAQHSYTSEVTTPATCTSAGVTTYTCTCGDTYTDTTAPAALGHSFTNYVPNNDATCTEDGTKTAVCDRNGCGVTDTITDEGTATGHSFTNYVSDKNATCTVDGTKTAACDNECGTTDTITDEGTATGHSFTTKASTSKATDATCTEAATYYVQCDNCTAVDTVKTVPVGNSLGHSFATEWSKDATHHWHAATCEHSTEKSGYAQHSYTSETTTPATCTSAGVTTYTCTCGDTYTDTTAPAALGHSFTNYVSDKNATCTADGTKTAACDNECGTTDTITDKDTATGHKYTSKVTKKATYAAAGVRTYTCSNGCGASYKETIPRLKITSTVKYNNSNKLIAGFGVTTSTKDVTVKWGKVADADGYIIYGNYCGKDFKVVKTVKGADVKSYTFSKMFGKKLDLNKNLKFYVVAYKTIDGKKVEFGKTVSAHITGGQSTIYTNPTKVTVKASKVPLNVGKSAKVKATVTYKIPTKKHASEAHIASVRYRSSDKEVATVDAKGNIKAVGAGTCTIYVMAANGVKTKVTVTVTEDID